MLIVYKHTETYEEVIAQINTNQSLTVFEALEVAGIDMDKYAASKGWDGYDPNALFLRNYSESTV